jgi:prolyl-tRNA synthetase
VLARRDLPGKEAKEMGVPLDRAPARIGEMLKEMQKALFDRAKQCREKWTREVNSYDQFKAEIDAGGFYLAHWDGTRETEDRIQAETKATIRCIPVDRPAEKGACMVTGRPSEGRVVLARAY